MAVNADILCPVACVCDVNKAGMNRAIPVTSSWANINPLATPACKISGLKEARVSLQTVYFPVL